MARPVSAVLSDDGIIYVINDDGSVFHKRTKIGTWEESDPVPGTPRARERAEEERAEEA